MNSPLSEEIKNRIIEKVNRDIIGIRIHGRGGQGGVISSKILAKAFYNDGVCPQTFPKYGVERRGAPAAAFVRITHSHKLIPLRCEIERPHHLMVLDDTLLHLEATVEGLMEGGLIVVNSTQSAESFQLDKFSVRCIDVTSIALKHRLGSKMAPIVNSAILGAFAQAFAAPKIESIQAAIMEMIPVKQQVNAQAALEAYQLMR